MAWIPAVYDEYDNVISGGYDDGEVEELEELGDAGGYEYASDELEELGDAGGYEYTSDESGDLIALGDADADGAGAEGAGILSNLGDAALKALKDRYMPGGKLDIPGMIRDFGSVAVAARAFQQASRPQTPSGYQGSIDMGLTANRALVPTATGNRPGAGGQRYFTDVNYANAAGLPAAQAAVEAQKQVLAGGNIPGYATPQTPAQSSGLANATGLWGVGIDRYNAGIKDWTAANPTATDAVIRAKMDEYGVSPADYAAALGVDQEMVQRRYDALNPVNAAQGGLMGLARGGPAQAKPRYLRGQTDGMADKIPATIDGNQPARLAHGEFVIPADVVSHLGNGNSDAGADQLYKMMDKIRHARTGNKKQGKRINPDKFTLGGKAYAEGGEVLRFADGGTLPSGTTGTDSNLATWAGPYVTDMLSKGQALAEQPYAAYSGPLTAGTSGLSQQAYDAASNWALPSSVTDATKTLGKLAATNAGQYDETAFSNQFSAPGAYTAGTFAPQFEAPTTYSPTDITTGKFDAAAAQQYMNPYLRLALDPQLEEARRQSKMTQMANAARATQAGAYGGSRQALMDSETQRNLGTNLANITGQGYNTAYTNAAAMFTSDQARALAAQQAAEQSKQFGAAQGMTAAQQRAQYGLAAQQAAEQSKQFGASQGMTAAQLQAQYAMEAKRAQEQSKQFGASLGLQGLAQQIAAAQGQGQLGISAGGLELQNTAQLGNFGLQQQATEQAGLTADKLAFETERDYPLKMLQFQQSLLQGLPLAATTYNQAPTDPYLAALSALGSGTALTTPVK